MVSEVQILQQVVSWKDGNPTPPVLEHSPFLFNLVLDAEVVIVVDHHHLDLAHAVVVPHFEVQLGVAVHHHAALLDHVLEWTYVGP